MGDLIRVLYVDDSPLDRELVLDALVREHGGFVVSLAANRAEFDAALQDGEFEIVLSDFNILGFEGLQVLDAVKARNQDIPVIIVTGTGSEEVAAEAIKRGAADYVIKSPSHILRLPTTIHAAFEKQLLERQHRQTENALRERVKELRGLHAIAQDMEAAGTLDDLSGRILERIPPSMQFPERVVVMVEIDGRRWVKGDLRDDLPPPIQSTVRDKKSVRGFIRVCYTENLPFLLPEEQDFLDNIASALGRWLERKQAEEVLQQTARELAEAQAVAHLGSWRLDLQGGMLTWSEEVYRIFGVEEGEFEHNLQAWLGRFVHLDDQRRILEYISHIQGESTLEPIEFRIIRSDGAILWVLAQLNDRQADEFGKIIAAKGIIQDITRLRNAETLLRLQGAALESAANAMVIVDMAGVFIWGNQAWANLTGHSVSDAIGQRLNILMPDDPDMAFPEQLWAPILGGNVWRGEVISKRKDGSQLFLEQTITPVRNNRGEVEHFIAVLQDVTLRRQAEDTLRRQNAYLNALQEITLGLLSELDLDDLLDAIVRHAGELISTPSAYLALVDEEADLLIPKVGLGALQESLHFPLKRGEGLAGKVWEKESPILVNDYDRWEGRIAAYSKGNLGSILAVPLFLENRVCGVLGLAYDAASDRSFNAGDIDTLAQFARLASLAIKNARLYRDAQAEIEQRRQAEREYRLLLNLTRAIADAETFDEAIIVSLRMICENMGLDYGEVWFPAEDGEALVLSNAFYAHDERMIEFHRASQGVQFVPGEGIAGYVWLQKKPLWLPDIFADRRFVRKALAERAEITMAASIPVYTRDKVVSVIVLFNRESRPDGKKIIDLISSVATQLGHAFERKRAEIELLNYSDVLEEQVLQRTAELRIAKDQADAANRAKSDFLATVSHEIRTPLNGVLGLAALMQQTDLDSRQKNYISKIQASGEILLANINDILDFSKIEAGKLTIESVEFDLHEIFQKISGLVGFRAQEKGLALSFQLAPEIPACLVGDPLRLEQVLLNLVGNAIKFTEKGQVMVSAQCTGKARRKTTISFSVEDTGIGMTPAQLDTLYQPFNQGDTSTSRKYGGTGLGLTISQRLVRSMGGEITAESVHGRGSKFVFSLTLSHKSGARRRRSQPKVIVEAGAKSVSLRGRRILLVEDNEINQMVAAEMLQGLGVEVTIAANGEQALKTIELLEFDAILMDIQMPGMDGFEVTRRIRNHARYADPSFPIIAMTAYAMTGDRDKVLQAGMNDYIPKPVELAQMTAILVRWLPGREPVGQPNTPAQAGMALNRTTALQRLNDNEGLYLRLLGMFEQDHAGMVDKIRAALQSGDLDAARLYVHTLKGTAGTIGADALQAAALRVEKALVGSQPGNLDELLHALDQAMWAVLVNIRTVLSR